MQSIWCRITEGAGLNESNSSTSQPLDFSTAFLSMNVRFRSNDAYKAAFMNIFALVQLQQKIASRVSELSGRTIRVGRYCHLADSYHLYGSYFREFESRFLTALEKRTFEQRTLRYQDLREIMESARPAILQKARQMGR
jgi:thymidylate synthase